MAALPESDKFKLSLARALVANPTVLCMHKPALAYDAADKNRAMMCLRHFVQDRGLCIPDIDSHAANRRPRTVIYTANRITATACADHIYWVDRSSIKEVTKQDVERAFEVPNRNISCSTNRSMSKDTLVVLGDTEKAVIAD